MSAECSRTPQLDEISCVAHTCQPDRARGSQEITPLVKKPVWGREAPASSESRMGSVSNYMSCWRTAARGRVVSHAQPCEPLRAWHSGLLGAPEWGPFDSVCVSALTTPIWDHLAWILVCYFLKIL